MGYTPCASSEQRSSNPAVESRTVSGNPRLIVTALSSTFSSQPFHNAAGRNSLSPAIAQSVRIVISRRRKWHGSPFDCTHGDRRARAGVYRVGVGVPVFSQHTNHIMKTTHDVFARVRAEYLEMPGLTLTAPQVERLCGIDSMLCRLILDALVGEGFLRVNAVGAYARLIDVEISRCRPAQAALA